MFEHRLYSTGTAQIAKLASKIRRVIVSAKERGSSRYDGNQRFTVDMADLGRWFKCCHATSDVGSLCGIVEANS
tara:strand:- start:420 stop:641 length:222 start_codon:yes stop_codon:yes gene_type:complete